MKYLVIIILTASIVFTVSCKKDEPQQRTPVGFWKGKLTDDYGSYTIHELFRSDSTMREYYNAADTLTSFVVDGTFSFSENIVYWTTDYGGGDVYRYVGVLSSLGDSIVGTWGESPSNFDGGTIALERQ